MVIKKLTKHPFIGNGLIQRVVVEKSTQHKWVNLFIILIGSGMYIIFLSYNLTIHEGFRWIFNLQVLASVAQFDVHPVGDQEVAGLIPARSSNILSRRLIMKSFVWSFPSADSRRAVVSFGRKNMYTTSTD